jgi:hypothetical protein
VNLMKFAASLFLLLSIEAAAETTAKAPGAVVKYEGIPAAQAEALAGVISAAREVYVTDFAADMPEAVTLTVRCGPGQCDAPVH